MVFIETSVFTKAITNLLSDDDYTALQQELLLRPESGVLIRGGSGLRKIRWNISGSGKRGGIRIIYYPNSPDEIFMLYAYKKNEQEDLTNSQLKILQHIISEWLL